MRGVQTIFFSLTLLSLSGCAALTLGGAGLGGTAIVQERSVGDAVDDLAIGTSIRATYMGKDVYNYTNIDIDVSTGRVLLTGSVKDPVSRVDAVKMAWSVRGVKEVLNEIQVTDKTSLRNFARDAFITAQVRAQIAAKKGVKSLNYSVETVNGIVYLIGNTRSQEELETVAQIASRTKGVKKVVSYVRVLQSNQDYNIINE